MWGNTPAHMLKNLGRFLVLGTLCVAFAHAQNPSLEDRLARVEAAIARIEAKLNDTVSPDELAPTLKEFSDLTRQLGWDGKAPLNVVKVAGNEQKLTLGGFIHAQFESGGAPDTRYTGINDRFLLRRTRVNLAGAFAENVAFKLEADFGNNSIATKTGISGQLTDAFVNWTPDARASVRVGQFKTPFGFEQLQPDTKTYTIERSLPNDRLTVSRQIGAMLYGDPVPKRLSYSVGAFNGTGVNASSNDNQKFMWVGRLNGVAYEGKIGTQKARLAVGGDYFTTNDKGTFTGRREGYSYDAQLAVGPAELQAEWLRNTQHPTVGSATTAEGWSMLGAYNFAKRWQGVVRYENYDSNTALNATTSKLWTFGLNFLLKGDDLKFSLNYLQGDPAAPVPSDHRFLGRIQVVF